MGGVQRQFARAPQSAFFRFGSFSTNQPVLIGRLTSASPQERP